MDFQKLKKRIHILLYLNKETHFRSHFLKWAPNLDEQWAIKLRTCNH
jgi:hypothetical protein